MPDDGRLDVLGFGLKSLEIAVAKTLPLQSALELL
ncbi:hypothetical protein BVRB_5g115770 [Beta vulgaris subsp. vulgaris]|nr:hypothetical protein BVRB_5g115770 [Beta vulgaris subsp. vulgaris]